MIREEIVKKLEHVSSKEKADILKRFFKTGKGEYGERDIFVGITIANIRSVCKEYYKDITLEELVYFLISEIHEYRMFGFLILTYKWKKANDVEKKDIYSTYVKYMGYVNNWDLVDLTAPTITGGYLLKNDRNILYTWVKSSNLWIQRISIMSTFTFLRNGEYEDTFEISKILLHHKHDLIHKAVGWMLREVGKRDQKSEEDFLKRYYKGMPRTMLRYAIERFEESKRLLYLKGSI